MPAKRSFVAASPNSTATNRIPSDLLYSLQRERKRSNRQASLAAAKQNSSRCTVLLQLLLELIYYLCSKRVMGYASMGYRAIERGNKIFQKPPLNPIFFCFRSNLGRKQLSFDDFLQQDYCVL